MRLLLYDRVDHLERGRRMRAVKGVTLSEEYFPGHFSRQAMAPATVMTEMVAQVGGWLVMASLDFSRSAIVSIIQDVTFGREVRPGDHLTVDCEILELQRRCAWVTGRALAGRDQVVRIGHMMFALLPYPDQAAPERERERFAYLSGGRFQGVHDDRTR